MGGYLVWPRYSAKRPELLSHREQVTMKISLSPATMILIVIISAGVVWAYFGFPFPDTLASLSDAKEQCVRFAEKNAQSLFPEGYTEIKAVDM
jgi:hypothetical protein